MRQVFTFAAKARSDDVVTPSETDQQPGSLSDRSFAWYRQGAR
jgi:hypothetical protein